MAVEEERAFNKRSALRESLLSIWMVDLHEALRMCEDRQVEVSASDASYVLWTRLTTHGKLTGCEVQKWTSLRRVVVSGSEGRQVRVSFPYFLLVSSGLHAFALLRPVGLPSGGTRSRQQ